MDMQILNVTGLKKVYTTRFGGSQVTALRQVDFSVEEGEYVAIMGESGSGKTTLLNILAALDKPTAGRVELDGRDMSAVRESDAAAFRRDNLGFVFQEFNLLDTFTLRAEVVEVRDKPTYPIGEFAIDAFGHKPVYEDRGIRRRAILALGRADVGELESLLPREEGITVIGGSSDHCILDVEDCPRRLEVGDVVEFSLCYSHMLYATARSDMHIQFVN